jgi:UDP-N-acetylglucosamine 2-epimerase (non-hydrolysing)
LLKKCRGIISDSGGVQEEAACLRKKVIVCRDNTERPEAVNVGISRVVGTDVVNNFKWLITPMDGHYDNPYGDGNACDLIINSIGKL